MNLSVVELAQLLTQALDENFHIKNQSAVVKVVTCFEAFKITHESYREVQNTRIIKDLQALRQNKANDQVLAKRIKNLLRKWKERLASNVIPSHPNSPQNISQGSSDTQFMTQSPPNSQPPRIVNGPTSFKNLLPKSQQNYHQVAVITSPVPQNIHQNGLIESSTPNVLLGKRKMPMDGASNASSNEIDDSIRKSKMMKKSDLNSLNANSNSLIHPNNQQNNNKIHSNVPATPQQNNIISNVQPKVEEPPKKRGRRKGSKGFDATLNGTIPDFQAEIQQKIALSAGKRNKTTFELQQMLESHQNTCTSWTNGDVHDSNSLDRVNSTASSYAPAEPVYSNFDLPKVKKEAADIKREPKDEILPVLIDNDKKELVAAELTIEDEIAKLYSKLPPIDYEAALRARFSDLSSYDENGAAVDCTCSFREVVTYESNEDEKSATSNGQVNGLTNNKVNMNGDSKNNKSKSAIDSELSENDTNDETDDFCAVEDDDDVIMIEKSPPRSAVKSIFDPEYDANENLIEEMVRRKPTRETIPKIIEVKIEKKDAVKSSRIELTAALIETSIERVPIITYVCDEDPMCRACVHFQRDPVTKKDVKELHVSLLNGINGYWNGISEDGQEPDYSKDNENIDYAKHQLWKRVVPRYNFLTLDKIPKTFDNSLPFSIPPPPHETTAAASDDTKIKSESAGEKFSMHGHRDIDFREWHEVMNVKSYNDEILTILPYVVID